MLPDRHGSNEHYRYGFQGQEKDDELKGEGNSLNYEFRMHDPRVGRFFAVDPLTKSYPFYSPYIFSGNRINDAIELEGKEPMFDLYLMIAKIYIKSKLSLSNSADRMMGPITKNNEAINNTPFVSEKGKELLYNVDAISATVDLQGKTIGVGTVASGFVISGAYLGVGTVPAIGASYESYVTWYGTTSIANYFAAGVGGTGSLAMLDAYSYVGSTNSLYHGTVGAGTNLFGQVMMNNFKFDENINYFQPIAAGLFNGLYSNSLESSFVLNKDKNGWHFRQSTYQEYSESFSGNLFGNKVESQFLDISKPLTKFSITVKPIIDIFGGVLIEGTETEFSKNVTKKLNDQFSSESENKPKKKG